MRSVVQAPGLGSQAKQVGASDQMFAALARFAAILPIRFLPKAGLLSTSTIGRRRVACGVASQPREVRVCAAATGWRATSCRYRRSSKCSRLSLGFRLAAESRGCHVTTPRISTTADPSPLNLPHVRPCSMRACRQS
jgi:hypothetical protein